MKLPAIKPMLAKLVDKPFDDPEWLFEIKWDGYRALGYKEGEKIELLSRNDLSFNSRFPILVKEFATFKHDLILDGEIVILDKEGKSQFQLMQNYQRTGKGDLHYYVFDLLYLDGKDLRDLPLIERKKLLKQLIQRAKSPHIHFSDHLIGQGVKFFELAAKKGLEGIMGKMIQSPYRPKRSGEWVKMKVHQGQEVVIGGFTPPQGSRKHFGALLVGVFKGEELVYAGRVGGGFTGKLLAEVYAKMEPLIQKASPFKTSIKPSASVTWIKPQLICEVSFQEWTSDNLMRQPIFKGLRIDKNSKDVKMEKSEKISTKAPLSHLDKVYWPKEMYTKNDLISYYREVAPYILPYLKDRPVMLRRYPDGIAGEDFYQKDTVSLHLPAGVKTVSIKHETKTIHYLLIQDLPTLEYAVNLGTIELHAFFGRVPHLDNPDYLVIDLDPLNIDFEYVIKTAQVVHEILESIKVKSYCKTSGATGLHIEIPLGGRYTFDQGRQFGLLVGEMAHQELSEFTSLERMPKKRDKKVYIDLFQNSEMKTVVAPYSVRGRDAAPVSTPLLWEEVKKGLDPTDFTIKTVPERLKEMHDLFKPVLQKGINLSQALTRLEKLS